MCEVVDDGLREGEEPFEALGDPDPALAAGVVGDADIGIHEDPILSVQRRDGRALVRRGGKRGQGHDISMDEAALRGIPERIWLGTEMQREAGRLDLACGWFSSSARGRLVEIPRIERDHAAPAALDPHRIPPRQHIPPTHGLALIRKPRKDRHPNAVALIVPRAIRIIILPTRHEISRTRRLIIRRAILPNIRAPQQPRGIARREEHVVDEQHAVEPPLQNAERGEDLVAYFCEVGDAFDALLTCGEGGVRNGGEDDGVKLLGDDAMLAF